jgi:hypothetical protein
MIVIFLVAAAAIVFIIAAAVIGREARRLDDKAPQPVFDMDEAVRWVADHLPYDVSAALSYDDVRTIIDWNLEYFRSKGVSSNGSGPHTDAAIVVGGAETVEYVLAKAILSGNDYTPMQVHAVLEAQMAYLVAIGAVGSEAGADEVDDIRRIAPPDSPDELGP